MKVAAITGAGGGLGRVFSTALAADGWTIIALGRTEHTLEETLAHCHEATTTGAFDSSGDTSHATEHAPTTHTALVCDITNPRSVEQAFSTIQATYGQLDLLVNNAGIPGPTGRIDSITIEEFDQTLATNLRGTFLCSQAAFHIMAKQGGGRIINNGSIAAHSPRAGAASYAASKAAVASLTTSLSLDGRDLNIVATELDIGNSRTELLGTFTGTEPMFSAKEAGKMLVAIANLPLNVTADHLVLTASGMPYLGRG